MLRKVKVFSLGVLCALLFLGLLIVFGDVVAGKAEVLTVAADGFGGVRGCFGYCKAPLNVRREMSVESEWISQYPEGATIVLLEDLGNWYRVDGGFVAKEFVFESVNIERLGIVVSQSDIYGDANFYSGVVGYVLPEEACWFVQKRNGFVELASGGWISESAVTFDFVQVYDYPESKLLESDMEAWNMVNLSIGYIGTLSSRTKAQGVTNSGGLYFKDSIPIYGIIDGFAYFPSGRHIYKLPVDRFEGFEEVGPTCEILDAYRTVYYSSSKGRKHNIELVSSILDGTVIGSGKTFSYNKTTGPRSEGKGYQVAAVIENGEYVDGFGGGVCQVSSTIYAAVMHDPNIGVSARKKHGLEVSYLPYGMDATVNYGSVDLKFVNKYPFDVRLNVHAQDGVCLVTLTRVE